MLRLAAVFIVFCMALIATSVGGVGYLVGGLSLIEASLASVAILAVLAFYNFVSGRMRDRENVSGQIADLSRGTADLARQVGELGRRVIAIEGAVTKSAETIRMPPPASAVEIGELGGIVKKLAETVAAHDAVLLRGAPAPAAKVIDPGPIPIDKNGDAIVAIDPADFTDMAPELSATGPFKGLDRNGIMTLLRAAIEANRIDMYLQPIVSLPQRKVRYYEALSRLRLDNGEVMLPTDFLAFAESGGFLPRIDNMLLFRCVQVLRRLVSKNREIGLFCNISAATLSDPEYFPQFSEFLQANRALAPSLILEFSQATLRDLGPIEQENLAALAEFGFRFSIDRLSDLRLEPRDLADRGFRFVKVPASLLLNRMGSAAGDIHASDFSDLLGRFGIDLIAEKIESEGMVVDLLDYDVRFGQGFLFSPPRPVRAEALEAAPRLDQSVNDDRVGGGVTTNQSGPAVATTSSAGPRVIPQPGKDKRAALRGGARPA